MKKVLQFGVLAAGMLLSTSCQNDEMENLRGNEGVVSFTLEQPGIVTRAYSDGLSAERLSYAVFEVGADGTQTKTYSGVNPTAFTNKQANITFALEKGKTYQFAFWADNENSPYKFDEATGTVTVDYTDGSGANMLLSNDETRDAFFASDKFEIPADGSVIKTITLYRPFAQLNIGAIGSNAVGLENPTQSEVSIANGVYSTLNILTGEVDDEVTTGVTYAMNTIPGDTEKFPVDGVDNYFAMNYLLVAKDKALVEVGFTLASDNNQKSRTFANIPVQRNHRTNIYGTIGNIISEAAEFICAIDERYDEPNYDAEVGDIIIGNERYKTFEEALANVADGAVIELGAGIYTIPAENTSTTNKTLTFKGTGSPDCTILEFGGVIGSSDGDGVNYAFDGSTVTFENLCLKPINDDYPGFARCNGTYKNCSIEGTYFLHHGKHTFEDCTFNISGDAYNLWTYTVAEATFTNCTFNGDGKAVLVYRENGESEVTFNTCTFNDNGGIDDKAAIEIGSDYGLCTYNININNCNVNGFDINPKGTNTGTTLWGNKNSMKDDKLNVVIDGIDVF